MTPQQALDLAHDRPSSCDDDLYDWAVDAENALRLMAERLMVAEELAAQYGAKNDALLETFAKVCARLGIDAEAAKAATGKPSDVLIAAINELAATPAAPPAAETIAVKAGPATWPDLEWAAEQIGHKRFIGAVAPELALSDYGKEVKARAELVLLGALAALSATPAEPQGWKLVPMKPTDAMLNAMRTGSRKDYPSDELCRVRYAAMLAAAPEAGQGKEQA